jgi:pimeloyl-ACP methyl ester carboxylesterase
MAMEVVDLVESIQDGPAVLVGHSLGGLIAVESYRHRPDLIAGLVLIDSADPAILARRGLVALQRFAIWVPRALAAVGLWPRIARSLARKEAAADARDSPFEAALAEGLLENLVSDSSRKTASAELAGLLRGAKIDLDEVGNGPIQVPLVVLSATKGGTSKKMRAAWTSHHRLLASTSEKGRHIEISGGHYLHREQPSSVIHEVLALLQDVERQ